MFHLNENFKNVLSPAKWRNKVSAFLNNICGDGIIDIHKPEEPNSGNPPVVKIKIPALVNRLKDEGYGDITHPFALRQTYTTSGSTETVSGLLVYLPTLTFTKDGTDYAIEEGTGTGQVSAHQEYAGWYTINGFTTGEVWLVDDSTSTTKRMKFATAEVSGKPCHHLGKSANTGVEQYPVVMNAKMQGAEGGGGGAVEIPPVPLEVRAELTKNSDGVPTGINYLKVYLPNAAVSFGRTDYTLVTGTGTGQVQAVSGEDGWYRVYGITTGTIYLVDSTSWSADNVPTYKAKFATSIPADTKNKLCHAVAVVSYDATAKDAVISQGPTVMGAVSGDCNTEHADGTHVNQNFFRSAGGNSMSILPTGESLDQSTWKRDETGVLKFTQTSTEEQTGHGTTTQVNAAFNGIKLQVVSRVRRSYDMDIFFWRWATFDKNGMLAELSAEQGAYAEVNYDRY